jgi:hypothetical protein
MSKAFTGLTPCRICPTLPQGVPGRSEHGGIFFGIASLEKEAVETPQQRLQRADQALVQVKRLKKPQTDRQPGRVIDFAGAAKKMPRRAVTTTGQKNQ